MSDFPELVAPPIKRSLLVRALVGFTRWFFIIVFTVLITLAVLVQLGREAFPLLNDYYAQISEILSERLDAKITVGNVNASWSGLTPKLVLNDIVVKKNDQLIFEAQEANAEISLLDSLLQWRIAWQKMRFSQLETTVIQEEDGAWHFQGISASRSNSKFAMSDPLDVFLFGRRIDINNITINVNFRSGRETKIELPELLLENDVRFHRLTAAINVDSDQAFKLVVEGDGDPRDKKAFQAKGYLQLDKFPVEKLLAAVGLDKTLSADDAAWRSGNRLDLALWFEGNLTDSFSLNGSFLCDGVPLRVDPSVKLPNSIQSQIIGKWQAETGLEVLLDEFRMAHNNTRLPPMDLLFYNTKDNDPGFKAPNLDIDNLMHFANKLNLFDALGEAGEMIRSLNPSGAVRFLDLQLTDKDSGYFRASGLLERGSIDAVLGIPSIKNANGYVQATLLGGSINLYSPNDFEVFLPKVYKEPMRFNTAKGQVVWGLDLDKRAATIHSSLITLEADTETANGYLYLFLPFTKNDGEPEMKLLIGLDNSIAKSHKKYVPKIIANSLYTWLNASIQEGSLSDVGFMYHGSLMKKPQVKPTMQIYGKIQQGRLKFNPKWPALENIDADLYVDNSEIFLDVSQATLKNNQVQTATVTIEKNDTGRALLIQGKVNSDVRKAMSLLQDSPLKKQMGSTFDQWQLSGDMNATMKLLVPLDNTYGIGSQRIDISMNNADVYVKQADIHLKNISGEFAFDSQLGLIADDIHAKLWGEKLVASISSKVSLDAAKNPHIHSTEIAFDVPVDVNRIAQWKYRPELMFLSGRAPVHGLVTIAQDEESDSALRLDFTSSLKGIAIDLPAPFKKPIDHEKALSVSLVFPIETKKEMLGIAPNQSEENQKVNDGTMLVEGVLGQDIGFSFKSRGRRLESAALSFNKNNRYLSDGYFDIFGDVKQFDLRAWNASKALYLNHGFFTHASANSISDAELPVRLNIHFGNVYIGDFSIDDITVQGSNQGGGWRLSAMSDVLAGSIIEGVNGEPYQVAINYFRLPKKQATSDKSIQSTSLSGVDVSSIELPDIAFTLGEFSVGEKLYGNWSGRVQSIAGGLVVDRIAGNLRGLSISGLPENQTLSSINQSILTSAEPGARLIWTSLNNIHRTAFDGGISVRNIGDVLQAFDQPRLLRSERGQVNVSLQWQGAPDAVSTLLLEGAASVYFRNGSFLRGASAGENPLLRLIGLFNFDKLARRLRLDFSDLSKKGFIYDRVRGSLSFNKGEIVLATPMQVEASTSKMQLGGTIDARNETLDTELVVTLPIGGNLTMGAALTAGLPAALGVYIVSKLFSRQVDKVSSINYSVKGRWDEPKIKVRRIFNDSAAKRKSQSAKDKVQARDSLRAQTNLSPWPNTWQGNFWQSLQWLEAHKRSSPFFPIKFEPAY